MKTPHELSDSQMELAEQYSRYSGELAKLIKTQAEYFNSNRDFHKSDTAVQRAFDVTDSGVTMTIVKMKLKALEKEMSAIKTHLRLLENEAKNLY